MDKHPMKKKTVVLILLLLAISFLEPYSDNHEFMVLQDEVFKPISEKTLLISTEGFLRKDVFYSDLSQRTPRIAMDTILAGILPHHNVAHSYLNRFYQTVSEQEIDLIVLISPSHYNSMKRFSLIQNDYDSYEGILEYHKEILKDLLINPLFQSMEVEEVRLEHGIGVHVPYIKKYCPQAKFLGICIGETRELSDLVTAATQITEVIRKYSNEEKVLYVASIDFSHYLSYEEALTSDAYTEKLLLEHDAVGMSKLNDHYIDSPSTYGLLMKLLDQRLGCSENERINYLDVQIIEKGNSELFSPIKNLEETTSYFFVSYGKK